MEKKRIIFWAIITIIISFFIIILAWGIIEGFDQRGEVGCSFCSFGVMKEVYNDSPIVYLCWKSYRSELCEQKIKDEIETFFDNNS